MPYPEITGILTSIATKFGGDITQWISQLLKGIDIGVTDPTLKPLINTDWRFKTGRLRLIDTQPTPNEVNYALENQTGSRTITIPVLDAAGNVPLFTDLAQTVKNKIINANDNNTFQNVPANSISGVISTGNLPATNVYTDVAAVFGAFDYTWQYGRAKIKNSTGAQTANLGFSGAVNTIVDILGTGAPMWLVGVTKAGLVNGDLLYYNGTNFVRRGIGTEGQILKMTSGLPVWGTAPGGPETINLSELIDVVYINPILEGQVLKWDSANLRWINGTDNTGTGSLKAALVRTLYVKADGAGDYITLQAALTFVMTRPATEAYTILLSSEKYTNQTTMPITRGNFTIRGQGSGRTIIEGGLSLPDASRIIEAIPVNSNAGYALTANATAGSRTITVSVADSANFSVNQYVLLKDNRDIDWELAGRKPGELHRVVSIEAGTGVITLDSALYEGYTIANTGKIAPLTNFYENITIEGVTITSAKTSVGAGLTGGQTEFQFIRNLQFIDVDFDNLYWAGTQIWQVWDATFTRCKFKKISVVSGSTPAFGASIRGACLNVKFSQCIADGNRHAITQAAGSESPVNGSGRTRNIVIEGNTLRNTTEAHIDIHQGALGVVISNNTCISDAMNVNAIQTRSAINIAGNTIQGFHGKGVYVYGPDATNSRVSDNWINGCTYGIYGDLGAHKLQINDNKIFGCSIDGIYFHAIATDHAGDYSIIVGNQINDNVGDGIEINSAIGVDIVGNQIRANGASIRFTNTDGTLADNTIQGNHVTGNTTNDPVGTTLGTGNKVRNNIGVTIDQNLREELVAHFTQLRDANLATTYATCFTMMASSVTNDIIDGLQESQSIDFTGKTLVKAAWYHRRNGTGTQKIRVIETATSNVLLEVLNITSDGKKTFPLTAIPAAFINRGPVECELQVASTVTTDDFTGSNFMIWLK
jgi:hypothetical protein